MIEYIKLPFKFLLYNISRKINRPILYPVSYTYSYTNLCDSRCKTCNIWKNQEFDELSIQEWKKIIKDIGKKPFWITITGGNQFLRKDFTQFVYYIKKFNNPKIINVPVSATQPELIKKQIIKILKFLGNTKLILNFSIDGLEKSHDKIRGKKEAFKNTLKTIKNIKKLQKQNRNLIVGTYTVLSKYNKNEVLELKKLIQTKIKPDHSGFEIAEIRKEYNNKNNKFSIKKEEVIKIMKNINNDRTLTKLSLLSIKNHIRKKYNKYIIQLLKKQKELIPCYAGIASIEISPTGEIWECANKTSSMGNLRKNSFKKIFFGKKAKEIRQNIKTKKCFCTHSNPFYTNYLCKLITK